MNHDRAQELILDLAYGELAPAEAREVERHVAECTECSAEWARIADTRRASARLADVRDDDRRRAAILAAARQAVAPPPQLHRSRAKLWTAAAGMAVAVLVGGVTLKLTAGRPVDRVASVAPANDEREQEQEHERDASRFDVPPDAKRAAASDGARDAGGAPGVPAPPRPRPTAPRRERTAQAPERTAHAAERVESGGSKAASRDEVASAAAPRSEPLLADGQRAQRESADGVPASAGDAHHGAGEARSGPPAAAPAAAPDSHAAALPAPARALPAPDRAPAAPDRALRSRASLASERADASRAVVAGVESLLASGALAESSRPVTCGADSLQQRSWADGERIRKVVLTARDGASVEGWYDREGRLRALRARSDGPEPTDLRRDLDEHGAVIAEERRITSARDLTPWLPLRDPAHAPADGCRWR